MSLYTLDNDGVPFCWTSNMQIVSKVFLAKSSAYPRTYTLPASDKKMAQTKVKAMS